MTNTTNRLETIATRQRRSRVRDTLFAVAVLIAGVLSVGSVASAARAARATAPATAAATSHAPVTAR